ncbi:MAG: VacJ family lipoprotein [Alphaproteobacteria bacterium]|nr:MAG: VacJ family lipoprotein [Alphaproteobacteria bacterium]
MFKGTHFKAPLGAGLMLLTAACASTSGTKMGEINDPLEGMNRATFEFNRVVDRALIRPISATYIAVVPEAPRQGVSNIMRNLREPWVFVNDILQFKFKRAGETLGRFIVNSTVGLAGLFKASDKMGIPYHREDFGQTLAVWGVGDGPYLVLPFIGPSTGRDAVGFAGDVFGDPVTIGIDQMDEKGANLTRTSIEVLDARARAHALIDQLYKEDDPYVVARSVYYQNRRFEIYDGNPPSVDDDLFDELEANEDAPDEDGGN